MSSPPINPDHDDKMMLFLIHVGEGTYCIILLDVLLKGIFNRGFSCLLFQKTSTTLKEQQKMNNKKHTRICPLCEAILSAKI